MLFLWRFNSWNNGIILVLVYHLSKKKQIITINRHYNPHQHPHPEKNDPDPHHQPHPPHDFSSSAHRSHTAPLDPAAPGGEHQLRIMIIMIIISWTYSWTSHLMREQAFQENASASYSLQNYFQNYFHHLAILPWSLSWLSSIIIMIIIIIVMIIPIEANAGRCTIHKLTAQNFSQKLILQNIFC